MRFIPAHAGNTSGDGARWLKTPVHPRACGEHPDGDIPILDHPGSSPRMRGTLVAVGIETQERRFIPAHAGNTFIERNKVALSPVHPRACGEHPKKVSWSGSRIGSSPRMRGTRLFIVAFMPRPRFIPAHAGNTWTTICGTLWRTVHPRACGEHLLYADATQSVTGSSPRMRGTQSLCQIQFIQNRFIPAHAGNTTPHHQPPLPSPVHPRACGEHSDRRTQALIASGSSPRMRGTPISYRPAAAITRFIPAHAGNTIDRPNMQNVIPVHPRACGEHAAADGGDRDTIGSSPRMRGTRQTDCQNHGAPRFIPAHAGNTQNGVRVIDHQSVHPRACGEHTRLIRYLLVDHGSSPRMRGTPQRDPRADQRRRFIPAHAGNTSCCRSQASILAVHPRACGEHMSRET